MIVGFLRLILGLLLLPACWGMARVFFDSICVSASTVGFSVESISLLGGMAAFSLCWAALSHPIRVYVLGHELTHAMWGVLFGAKPSDVRVGTSGGSVRLTKTNFLITLAPYFFPFYTFVVIIAGLITYAFLRPLPFLPLWMFLIGFTWAFHVLFTIQTLCQRQPDITAYGRIFSWSFIFIANLFLIVAWLVATTPLTFGQVWDIALARISSAYIGLYYSVASSVVWLKGVCS